jgi:hypothetical protein
MEVWALSSSSIVPWAFLWGRIFKDKIDFCCAILIVKVKPLVDTLAFQAGFIIIVVGALLSFTGIIIVESQTAKLKKFASREGIPSNAAELDGSRKSVEGIVRLNGYALICLSLGLLSIIGGLLIIVRSTWPTLTL